VFANDVLKDKVVLITGGGTGLGRAMGEKFLSLGAKLAIASRRQDVLEKAAQEMSVGRSPVLAVPCDVRQPEQVSQMLDTVIDHFGRIDVLVNNAAGNFISPTERLSHRAFDAVIGIVLQGTTYCTLDLGKRWIAAKQPGTVLNIVTTYAWTGSGYVVPSAVAKAGVLALTRSLAVEWAKYGIRHVAIAPGPFPTEGAWSRLAPTPDLVEKMVKRIPLGRVGEKEELANLAAYLISDYAAYINGEVVTIDGGEWLKGAGEFNDLDEVPRSAWDQLAELTKKGK
jgi:NAD(P)-dependent dehydrogenase (short-subunit alcohol dehydrogenase family)